MKTQKHMPRMAKTSNSRWLAYAAAGMATALGSAPSAEAEIHYSGLVDVKMDGIRSVTLPLSGGASLFFEVIACKFCYPRAFFGITGAELGSARIHSDSSTMHLLANLKPRRLVSHGPFSSVAGMPFLGAIQTYLGAGYFYNPGNGIIGFKFDIGNGTQYGWARIKEHDGFPYGFVIKDYAWGDVGDSIETGQTSSTDGEVGAIPHSGSLGLLALGGVGLQAWRDSRMENQPSGR